MGDQLQGEIDIEWIRGLPKVELHTHLESIGEELTSELADQAGIDAPVLSEPRGLNPLLRYLDEIGSLVRTKEDAAKVAYRVSQRASESGAQYIEVIFNPTHWRMNWGTRLDAFIHALDDGFRAAESDGFARARLSASLLRTQSANEAVELVRFLVAERLPRVVALSVDGNETDAGMTGKKFASAFELAAESGLRRTIHTGESGGPQHMWDSLRYLRAERIDHGFRAIEDPDLVRHLVATGIALNMCPSQNLAMGWMDSLSEHPMRDLWEAGVTFTIGTDSSWKFKLAAEYKLVADTFNWDRGVLRQLAANSIDASFAPEEEKQELRQRLANYPD